MNIIIFSKDRACQLDLLLRSIEKYWPNHKSISILYTYSDNNFEKGYNKLIAKYPFINYKKETNFKEDTISIISPDKKYIVFFMDDMVFINPFDQNIVSYLDIYNNLICISLRLCPDLNYCYMGKVNMSRPNFDSELKYNWTQCIADFGYPMSLDGHIFRTSDIYNKIKDLYYTAPNQLEGELASNVIQNKPIMMCLPKSVVFNNPCNKVQTVLKTNRSGDISPAYMNGVFLNGNIIDLKPYEGLELKSCHSEEEIHFIKE